MNKPLFLSLPDLAIMERALFIMGDVFSGNQFSDECVTQGMDRNQQNSYKRMQFLDGKCKRVSRRVWGKRKDPLPDVTITGQQAEIQFDEAEFARACDLIKSRGGKILMPVTEFKEL